MTPSQWLVSSQVEVVVVMLTSSATSVLVAGLCATPLLAKQAIQKVAQPVTKPEIVLQNFKYAS